MKQGFSYINLDIDAHCQTINYELACGSLIHDLHCPVIIKNKLMDYEICVTLDFVTWDKSNNNYQHLE